MVLEGFHLGKALIKDPSLFNCGSSPPGQIYDPLREETVAPRIPRLSPYVLLICLSASLFFCGCRKARKGETSQEGGTNAPTASVQTPSPQNAPVQTPIPQITPTQTPSPQNSPVHNPSPQTVPAKPDKDRLQGDWIVVYQAEGAKGGGMPRSDMHLLIAGDRLTWIDTENEMKHEYSFALVAGKDKEAKNIDLSFGAITVKDKPLPPYPGKPDKAPLVFRYKPGMVFQGAYRLKAEPFEEDHLDLFLPFHPDHRDRPKVKWHDDRPVDFGRFSMYFEAKRVRSEAEKQEYNQPRANGVSVAEERAVREESDGNREKGVEHEPRYLLWEGAEVTDAKGVTRKIVRVKYYNPDLKKEIDELCWVEQGQTKQVVRTPTRGGGMESDWWCERAGVKARRDNPFGNDWKTKAANVEWEKPQAPPKPTR